MDHTITENNRDRHNGLQIVASSPKRRGPHTQFHVVDPGFLCGQVEAVVKLMKHQNGPVTLRFWDAIDFLPDYGFVVPRKCYKECGKLNV